MFTGIVSDIGTVVARNGTRLRIASRYKPASVVLGASIACDGCCLTVARLCESSTAGAVFEVEISNETSACTTLGSWREGTRTNLERPLALGAELGGHLLTGHIDAVARIRERTPDGDSVRFLLESPAELARFIAVKGSIALDGVSLTVNEVHDARSEAIVSGTKLSRIDVFGVNVIPYTLAHTTWGDRAPGDLVNLEVDLLARYVERIASARLTPQQDL
jgi:riboflavin synthase